LYTLPNINRVIRSRRMRWSGHVAQMEIWREETIWRPRHRWEDNIRMDLEDIGWEGVDWMHLGEDRDHWQALVNTVMNLWVP
jgi:hypothetical protein